MPGSEMPGQGGNGLQRGNSLQGGNALQGGSGLQGGRAEGLADLLSLIARLGTQGEEQQEDAVRLQLNTKIMAFFDKVSGCYATKAKRKILYVLKVGNLVSQLNGCVQQTWISDVIALSAKAFQILKQISCCLLPTNLIYSLEQRCEADLGKYQTQAFSNEKPISKFIGKKSNSRQKTSNTFS